LEALRKLETFEKQLAQLGSDAKPTGDSVYDASQNLIDVLSGDLTAFSFTCELQNLTMEDTSTDQFKEFIKKSLEESLHALPKKSNSKRRTSYRDTLQRIMDTIIKSADSHSLSTFKEQFQAEVTEKSLTIKKLDDVLNGGISKRNNGLRRIAERMLIDQNRQKTRILCPNLSQNQQEYIRILLKVITKAESKDASSSSNESISTSSAAINQIESQNDTAMSGISIDALLNDIRNDYKTKDIILKSLDQIISVLTKNFVKPISFQTIIDRVEEECAAIALKNPQSTQQQEFLRTIIDVLRKAEKMSNTRPLKESMPNSTDFETSLEVNVAEFIKEFRGDVAIRYAGIEQLQKAIKKLEEIGATITVAALISAIQDEIRIYALSDLDPDTQHNKKKKTTEEEIKSQQLRNRAATNQNQDDDNNDHNLILDKEEELSALLAELSKAEEIHRQLNTSSSSSTDAAVQRLQLLNQKTKAGIESKKSGSKKDNNHSKKSSQSVIKLLKEEGSTKAQDHSLKELLAVFDKVDRAKTKSKENLTESSSNNQEDLEEDSADTHARVRDMVMHLRKDFGQRQVSFEQIAIKLEREQISSKENSPLLSEKGMIYLYFLKKIRISKRREKKKDNRSIFYCILFFYFCAYFYIF